MTVTPFTCQQLDANNTSIYENFLFLFFHFFGDKKQRCRNACHFINKKNSEKYERHTFTE